MTAEAAACAERGLSRLRAAGGGAGEEAAVEAWPPLERKGRREEPTTTPLERGESVIGDDIDFDFDSEWRGAAIAANLAPARGSTRDALAAAAGLSVEAEARGFIYHGEDYSTTKRREHTHSTFARQ